MTYIENPGIAFGISVGPYLNVLTFFSYGAILFIIYYLYSERNSNFIIRFSLAIILGGALGNIIDRSLVVFYPDQFYGVVDFIDIGIGKYRWYIFNVADSMVTVGIILYFIQSIQLSRQKSESY